MPSTIECSRSLQGAYVTSILSRHAKNESFIQLHRVIIHL